MTSSLLFSLLLGSAGIAAGIAGIAAAPANPARDQAVALAIETLARDLQLQKAEILLEEANPVDWPDTSLGCPYPGQDYAKVVTPGFRVSLTVQGHRHAVHVGGGRAVVCRNIAGIAGMLGGLPRERAEALRMYTTARSDLAGRKGVPEDSIRILSLRATTWPDGRLGCPPAPGDTSAPGDISAPGPATPGFLIELALNGEVFAYHTDKTRVVLCP